MSDPARLTRARLSLDGLSVGDAFGETFSDSEPSVADRIRHRELRTPPWRCTDDTIMAAAIVNVLARHGHIAQTLLAGEFARRYVAAPTRGYGATARQTLSRIAAGESWQVAASAAFGGRGSMGNGGAMRAAPVGAYFEANPATAALEAQRSAEITHSHVEGQAGAIAVAVAAAVVRDASSPDEMFRAVLSHTPPSRTAAGIETASRFPLERDVIAAASSLGNGAHALSYDTVPFALWCVAKCFDDFESALWLTVAGLGDRDTTCAIVGGIVALRDHQTTIPASFLTAREPLKDLPGESIDA